VKPWKERRMGDMVCLRRMKRGRGWWPRPIDPWIIWWIAMSLIVPLLALLEGVMWMAGKGFIVYGGSDLRRILRDVEDRYGGAFAELGPGALQDFKHLIDCVDSFFDLLADPKTDFMVKLTSYGKLRDDVFEFCRFYARWLGSPLMERLRAEIYELLEDAIEWWGWQEVYDEIGGW